MTISKTSPPVAMTVGDFREAALRHFNTCKVLWQYISLPAASNLETVSENDILKNIFYLNGYVVECAMKYRYLTDCHSLSDSHAEPYKDSLGKKIPIRTHFSFVAKPEEKKWSEETVQNLCSSGSYFLPNYLKILGQVTLAASLSPTEEIPYDMQASWEPTIRYHYECNGLILNKSDIEAFFQATQTLLRNLSVI